MAKVTLRTYIQEIEQAIDQKQSEEAIAHCRHILLSFPKHIDTYRLLGKAYLESQRYSNAADIFQRVLSAVPDDYIAHVGMSIIREDEGNLDAAIWHMERAFEGQPYNTAIQDELRRLFGRRDGMEPPKINLSRPALARMYARGNLFPQAIAELRVALKDDPQRPDLQVLLGKMYKENGDLNQAVQICSTLINKLPYCLEANRILAAVLPKTDRADDAKIYAQRLQALDPYEAYVSPQAPAADQVPSQAVMLDRLAWDGSPALAADSHAQPEWARSVGIDLDSKTGTEEGLPDWMTLSEERPGGFGADQQGDLNLPWDEDAETSQTPQEEIPDWMKEAGWEPASGEFDESQPAFDLDEDAEPFDEDRDAIAAEMPDWLKEMAPPGVLDESEAQPKQSASSLEMEPDQELPEWLSEPADDSTDTIITWLDEQSSGSEEVSEAEPNLVEDDQLPDWLPSAEAGSSAFLFDEEDGSAAQAETPAPETLPDWLAEMQTNEENLDELPDWQGDERPDEQSEPFTAESGGQEFEMPDWVDELKPDEAEEAEMPDWLSGLESEAEEAEPAEIPDWLAGITEEPEAEEPQPASSETEVEMAAPETEADEIPDWLSEFDREDEAAEPAEIPDWLAGIAEEPEGEEPQPASSEPEAEMVVPETEVDEIPDWLSGLESEAEEAEPAEIPDWLAGIAEEPEAEEPLPASSETEMEMVAPETEADEIPDWLSEFDLEDEVTEPDIDLPVDMDDSDAAMAWLESLAAKHGVPEEELITRPEDRIGETPAWLQELVEDEQEEAAEIELSEMDRIRAEAVSETESLEEELGIEAEEIPDWLKAIEASEIEESEMPASPEQDASQPSHEEIPPWLQGIGDEIPSVAGDTEISLPQAAAEDEQDEIEDIPDWLHDIAEQSFIAESPTAPAQPPGHESELPIDLDDTDAAMAWLESLAAKQGVPEEELITRPEDRKETPPDWVSQAAQAAEDEAAAAFEPGQTPEMVGARDETESALQEATAPEIASEELVPELEPVDIADWLTEPVEEPLPESMPAEEQSGPAVLPAGEDMPPDLDDLDAAMAWLESLAAKQGVSEEELITRPEDRRETPPEWVSRSTTEAGSETVPEPAALEAPPAEQQPHEITGADLPAIEMPVEEPDVDQMPPWLQASLAQEDALEEQPIPMAKSEHFGDIPEIEPETEEVPDWLQAQEVALEPEPVTLDITESEGEEPPAAPSEETAAALEDEALLDSDDLTVGEEEQGEELEEHLPAPPDWVLAGAVPEDERVEQDEYEWLPSVAKQELGRPAPDLLELNQASLIQLERLPGVGFRRAQAIVAYRDQHGNFASLDELLEVQGMDNETYETLIAHLYIQVSEAPKPERRAETGGLPSMPRQQVEAENEDHQRQLQAQEMMGQGDLDGALEEYTALINKGSRLEDIIDDLNQAIYYAPAEASVGILQTLGDAYFKAGQLQDALEAYTKAEQQLR